MNRMIKDLAKQLTLVVLVTAGWVLLVVALAVVIANLPWPSGEELAQAIGNFAGEVQKAADGAASKP